MSGLGCVEGSASTKTLVGEKLSCGNGASKVFSDVNCRLKEGEILWVKGANGTGKTTLLRILAGLSPPQSGRVLWQGEDIAGENRTCFHDDLLYFGHFLGVADDLTVSENLEFSYALLNGLPKQRQDACWRALVTLKIAHVAELPAHLLSFGQRKRVALSRLLLSGTRQVWLLDEPYSGLDTEGVEILSGVLESHLEVGGLLVVTSHQDFRIRGNLGRVLELGR